MLSCVFSVELSLAQDSTVTQTSTVSETPEVTERPNGKRIRRQVNLIVGVSHDEELLIPDVELVVKGPRPNMLDIKRIEGTDYFRINPKQTGTGIITLHNKSTDQILVELRFDIRDDTIERTLREIQSLLTDIEGIEYKIIGGGGSSLILLDGYVLLPKDLMRVNQVLANYKERVRSLVTLSPIARQRIAEFITEDVNNPEVKITAVGNFIKLEGQVNDEEERKRIKNIVSLYLPDIVSEKSPEIEPNITQIVGRKAQGSVEDLIVDLITIRPAPEKQEPPPKLIQIVAHFVKFNDNYSRSFKFEFSPALTAQQGTQQPPQTGVDATINLLNNLLPKLQWAKFHGYAKVLDTASILIQDKNKGTLSRNIEGAQNVVSNGVVTSTPAKAGITLTVTPIIKSERSGLVELNNLNVTVDSGSKSEPNASTNVSTTISVRDRQSAAFAGVIKKANDTGYGAPANENAIITFNASKEYTRNNSQFVVFVTPIIKSSASTGVEQIKKKFRLRD